MRKATRREFDSELSKVCARQVEKEGRKEWERAVMRQTLRQINLAVVEQVRHRWRPNGSSTRGAGF